MDDIIKKDGNYRNVGAGVTNDSDKDISMLRVDPITKHLLVEISSTTTNSEDSNLIADRDGNNRTVCMAWNETAQETQEILTDINGYLLCDLTFT